MMSSAATDRVTARRLTRRRRPPEKETSMADPQTAVANPLRNIEVKTGKSFAELCLLIQTSGQMCIRDRCSKATNSCSSAIGSACPVPTPSVMRCTWSCRPASSGRSDSCSKGSARAGGHPSSAPDHSSPCAAATSAASSGWKCTLKQCTFTGLSMHTLYSPPAFTGRYSPGSSDSRRRPSVSWALP